MNNKNIKIIVIGPKSSGKSSISKELSNYFRINYFEIDKLVEKTYNSITNTNLTYRQIYKLIGDKKYRILEYNTCKSIANEYNCIIDTGGSTLLNPNIYKLLNKNKDTIIIMLTAKRQELWDRTIQNGIPAFLENTKNPKDKFYKRSRNIIKTIKQYANITIDTSSKKVEETVNIIKDVLEK